MATRRMAASVRTTSWSSAPRRANSACAGLGRALAVVAGDLGDDLDLVVGEPGELLGVADHVVRVQVVLAVRDEQAHVGQQRAPPRGTRGSPRRARAGRRWRRTARARGRATCAECAGSSSHTSASEVAHAAPGDVAQVVERAAAGPLEGVEQHALAQRVVADDHLRPMANTSKTPSSMRAPARMMSARLASRPGTGERSPRCGADETASRPPRARRRVNSKPLQRLQRRLAPVAALDHLRRRPGSCPRSRRRPRSRGPRSLREDGEQSSGRTCGTR